MSPSLRSADHASQTIRPLIEAYGMVANARANQPSRGEGDCRRAEDMVGIETGQGRPPSTTQPGSTDSGAFPDPSVATTTDGVDAALATNNDGHDEVSSLAGDTVADPSSLQTPLDSTTRPGSIPPESLPEMESLVSRKGSLDSWATSTEGVDAALASNNDGHDEVSSSAGDVASDPPSLPTALDLKACPVLTASEALPEEEHFLTREGNNKTSATTPNQAYTIRARHDAFDDHGVRCIDRRLLGRSSRGSLTLIRCH
ncbi:MAG: hypothetical protein ABJQ14_08490, partial [Hyphomicrobiales bacterium]